MGNTIYLKKEKQVESLTRCAFNEYQHANTLGVGLSFSYDEHDSRDYDRCRFGYIEVNVTEMGGNHFSKRLEEFLVRAVALYDEVVLGNTKPEMKPEVILIKEVQNHESGNA